MRTRIAIALLAAAGLVAVATPARPPSPRRSAPPRSAAPSSCSCTTSGARTAWPRRRRPATTATGAPSTRSTPSSSRTSGPVVTLNGNATTVNLTHSNSDDTSPSRCCPRPTRASSPSPWRQRRARLPTRRPAQRQVRRRHHHLDRAARAHPPMDLQPGDPRQPAQPDLAAARPVTGTPGGPGRIGGRARGVHANGTVTICPAGPAASAAGLVGCMRMGPVSAAAGSPA